MSQKGGACWTYGNNGKAEPQDPDWPEKVTYLGWPGRLPQQPGQPKGLPLEVRGCNPCETERSRPVTKAEVFPLEGAGGGSNHWPDHRPPGSEIITLRIKKANQKANQENLINRVLIIRSRRHAYPPARLFAAFVGQQP